MLYRPSGLLENQIDELLALEREKHLRGLSARNARRWRELMGSIEQPPDGLSERRDHWRAPAKLAVSFAAGSCSPRGSAQRGWLTSLSLGGAFLVARIGLAGGERVDLCFADTQHGLHCELVGEVRWSAALSTPGAPAEGANGFGLRFVRFAAATSDGLLSVLRHQALERVSTRQASFEGAPAGGENSPAAVLRMPSHASSARARLLILDDDTLLRRAIARYLATDFEVVAAESAEQALALLDRETFDLILSDVMMPGLCGSGFHEALTLAHPQLTERVIFMTGGIYMPAERQAMEALPNRLLDKPLDLVELGKLLRGEIGRLGLLSAIADG